MDHDHAFEMATSNVRFGPGCTTEIGMDLADMGVRRVMLLTDPNLAALPPVATARAALEAVVGPVGDLREPEEKDP